MLSLHNTFRLPLGVFSRMDPYQQQPLLPHGVFLLSPSWVPWTYLSWPFSCSWLFQSTPSPKGEKLRKGNILKWKAREKKIKRRLFWEFPGSPVVRTQHFQYLIRELRSQLPTNKNRKQKKREIMLNKTEWLRMEFIWVPDEANEWDRQCGAGGEILRFILWYNFRYNFIEEKRNRMYLMICPPVLNNCKRIILFSYIFLAVLGLRCRKGVSLVAESGLLVGGPSGCRAGLQSAGFGSCSIRA